MFKYHCKVLFLLIPFLFLAACSSNSRSEEAKMQSSDKAVMDSGGYAAGEEAAFTENKQVNTPQEDSKVEVEASKQMVIYRADLQLRVKKFEETLQKLEEKVDSYGGYISESNVSRDGNEQISGRIAIRIPQKNFQAFLHDAEGQAIEVLQRNITGTDVTEEYVDLESRLKSKRVVEERLITFMKSAEKTEDLLKISNDLAVVQEEIETIQGRMKFLENQTSYSTVTISLYENKVVVPSLENEELNTWEKTKQQFMKSINILLVAISGTFVFLVGNLPILLIIAIIACLLYIIYRKIMKNSRNE